MDLSVIIVSWNVSDKLKNNLLTLHKSQGDFNFEVIVVDNDSHDDTVVMVKREFPQIKLIENNQNLGFGKANNQGIKIAQSDFILLLNPDMQVDSGTLLKMLEWMKNNPKASLASCKLINEQGKIIKHVRRFPTLSDQLAIVLKLPHLFPHILRRYIREDFDYSQASVVDSVRGGFMMARREVIEKIGAFDEQYFLWFEEVDLCLRIKKAGGEVWYTPVTECIDAVGQSFKQVETMAKQEYFRDSMLKYFRKWQPSWQYWILWLAWRVGLFLSWVAVKKNLQSKANT
jgi:GT2 family glycosyltransferase